MIDTQLFHQAWGDTMAQDATQFDMSAANGSLISTQPAELEQVL